MTNPCGVTRRYPQQEMEQALRGIAPDDVVAVTMSKSGVGLLRAYHALSPTSIAWRS